MTFDTRIGADSQVSGSYWQDTANTATARSTTPPPQGDGNFSSEAAGIAPQAELDLQLAMMANDSYTLQGANGVTGTQSGAELEAAGWTRLEPNGDHLVDADGNRVEIDPSRTYPGPDGRGQPAVLDGCVRR